MTRSLHWGPSLKIKIYWGMLNDPRPSHFAIGNNALSSYTLISSSSGSRLPRAAVCCNSAIRSASENALQLEYSLSHAGSGKFFINTGLRLSIMKRCVHIILETCLHQAPFPSSKVGDSGDTEALRRALSMYVDAGLFSEAELFFKCKMVVPFAGTRLELAPMLASAERRRGTGSGSMSAADALERAVEEALSFIGEKVTPLVGLVESEEQLCSYIDFVSAAVWRVIEGVV